MEIVAFDTDDKADGSGKAKITWISKWLLPTAHAMNATQKTVDGVTSYGAGGWEHSDMRAYLKDTIKPLIPETVRSAIVPVTKVQSIYTTELVKNGQTTTDDVWIPNFREVTSGDTSENIGAIYNNKFIYNSDRKKKSRFWWLRSVRTSNEWRFVYSDGSANSRSGSQTMGIALGFCT